jgi:hypothetical protein
MKNFAKLFGIVVFIAVIGFSLTACDWLFDDDYKGIIPKEAGLAGTSWTETSPTPGRILSYASNGNSYSQGTSNFNLVSFTKVESFSGPGTQWIKTITNSSSYTVTINGNDLTITSGLSTFTFIK